MDAIVNIFIRPERVQYSVHQLGPSPIHFGRNATPWHRNDFELTNPRGYKFKCSHWEPAEDFRPAKQLPCVVYLHGNQGCRLDASEFLPFFATYHVTLLVLDFTGAGQSEGPYISLGYHEQQDVETVVEHLVASGRISEICLWGRSMGAVTALLYAAKRGENNDRITALILDSPFANLLKLVPEVANSIDLPIPNFVRGGVMGVGMKMIRNSIQKKAGFDIKDLSPIDVVKHCRVPALFIHGESDDFIRPHHSQKLYKKYGGTFVEKKLLIVPGDHNSGRTAICLDSISSFLFLRFLTKEFKEQLNITSLSRVYTPPLLTTGKGEDEESTPADYPYFVLRRIPYPYQSQHMVPVLSLMVLVIKPTHVLVLQPFTGVALAKYPFMAPNAEYSVKGYYAPSTEDAEGNVFLLKVKDPPEDDGIVAWITIEAEAIVQKMEETVQKLLLKEIDVSKGFENEELVTKVENILRRLISQKVRRLFKEAHQNKKAWKGKNLFSLMFSLSRSLLDTIKYSYGNYSLFFPLPPSSSSFFLSSLRNALAARPRGDESDYSRVDGDIVQAIEESLEDVGVVRKEDTEGKARVREMMNRMFKEIYEEVWREQEEKERRRLEREKEEKEEMKEQMKELKNEALNQRKQEKSASSSSKRKDKGKKREKNHSRKNSVNDSSSSSSSEEQRGSQQPKKRVQQERPSPSPSSPLPVGQQLSVKELKALLQTNEVDCSFCLEKTELVELAKKHDLVA
ncbi:Serine aminopeptidase S33, variant 2 [Balamuthia mandrillaris]